MFWMCFFRSNLQLFLLPGDEKRATTICYLWQYQSHNTMDVTWTGVLLLAIFIHLEMTKNSIYFQKPIENRTISKNTMATTKSNLKSEQRHCYKGLSLTMMILLFDLPSPIVFWFRNRKRDWSIYDCNYR